VPAGADTDTFVSESLFRPTNDRVGATGEPPPTVVHFSTVILLAGGLSAPWHSLGRPSWLIGSIGGAGVVYGCVVIRHARVQTDYQAVRADWLWHNLMPMVAYVTLIVAAVLLREHSRPSAFAIAAASLLLLFIGIHNAWDTVTFIATQRSDA
jgi:hypothetical protein